MERGAVRSVFRTVFQVCGEHYGLHLRVSTLGAASARVEQVLVLPIIEALKPSVHQPRHAVIGSASQGATMKEVYEILQQKEADLAHVRDEIEALRIVGALLSNESLPKDAFELLQEKEACVARVRHEVESLQIVAPLLSEECGFNELTSQAANSTEETSYSIHACEAT
jgi:hypothetical protein